jgi:DNA-binding NarL/FixJ family response regulator
MTAPQIAAELARSRACIESHLREARRRVGVHNALLLVRWAYRVKLCDL